MRKTLAAALAAFTFAGAVATSADAGDRRRYHRDRDDDGAAIAAGIVGLALGAAIASGGRDRSYYDRGYYGRPYSGGYYDRRYYGPPRYAYYGPPRGYYRPYHRTCRTVSRWDPYYGGYVRVRRCW